MINKKDIDTIYTIYKEAEAECNKKICYKCDICNFINENDFGETKPECTTIDLVLKCLGNNPESVNLLKAIKTNFRNICPLKCNVDSCDIKKIKVSDKRLRSLPCLYIYVASILFKEIE